MTEQLDRIEATLTRIEKALTNPAYVVDMEQAGLDVANSLFKKISGRKFIPGEIIRLTKAEFELFRSMDTCPPRSR